MSGDDHFIRPDNDPEPAPDIIKAAHRLVAGLKVHTVGDALALMDDAALVAGAYLADQKWRPIAEAPAGDPEFQALACHQNADGWWSYYIINRHDIGGRYECWVVPPGRPIRPTHWRPLAAPPADPAPGTDDYEDRQRARDGEYSATTETDVADEMLRDKADRLKKKERGDATKETEAPMPLVYRQGWQDAADKIAEALVARLGGGDGVIREVATDKSDVSSNFKEAS